MANYTVTFVGLSRKALDRTVKVRAESEEAAIEAAAKQAYNRRAGFHRDLSLRTGYYGQVAVWDDKLNAYNCITPRIRADVTAGW